MILGQGPTHSRRLVLESLELRQLLSVNPIISEISADNGSGIVDSSGNHSDWLEICNPNSQQAVDLTGWSFEYSTSSVWTFPSMTLGPNESRVIFCTSGLSQTDPAQELHANFNLSKSGKYLALLDNNGNVVQEFSPTFPAMTSDISYGTGQAVTETKLVAAGATAQLLRPHQRQPRARPGPSPASTTGLVVGSDGPRILSVWSPDSRSPITSRTSAASAAWPKPNR